MNPHRLSCHGLSRSAHIGVVCCTLEQVESGSLGMGMVEMAGDLQDLCTLFSICPRGVTDSRR